MLHTCIFSSVSSPVWTTITSGWHEGIEREKRGEMQREGEAERRGCRKQNTHLATKRVGELVRTLHRSHDVVRTHLEHNLKRRLRSDLELLGGELKIDLVLLEARKEADRHRLAEHNAKRDQSPSVISVTLPHPPDKTNDNGRVLVHIVCRRTLRTSTRSCARK